MLFPPTLSAVEIIPFYTQNQSPLVQIYGLPPLREASTLPLGNVEMRLMVDLANNYVYGWAPKESLLLDGESTRITIDVRYGIARRMDIGLEIPYVILGGGFLDGSIEWFHSRFNFTKGWRDQAPPNRLLYIYERDGVERIKIDSSSNGLGDIRLSGGWELYPDDKKAQPVVALRASVKFPTGNSERLHGSGSTDFSLWVIASGDYKLALGNLGVFGAAGVMGMTAGKVLPEQQQNLVGFGGLGVGWSPLRWMALKMQINGHTSFYRESELREVKSASAQLTMGGTLAFSDRISLDIGVTEDIAVNTAPDVVIHFALRHRFE